MVKLIAYTIDKGNWKVQNNHNNFLDFKVHITISEVWTNVVWSLIPKEIFLSFLTFYMFFDGSFGLVLKLIFLISKTFSSNQFNKECRDFLIPSSIFLVKFHQNAIKKCGVTFIMENNNNNKR